MRSDYHIHTHFSDDCEYPMEQVVEDAIAIGLEEICFTDHVDYGIKRDWDDPRGFLCRSGGPEDPASMPMANVDYPTYVSEICRLRQKYAGRIHLGMGLEFGAQQHTLHQYRALYRRYPWDFILLSVHAVDDREFWNGAYQADKSQQEYITGYYEAMLELVHTYKDYSILAHMDMIARYDPAGPYPFEELEPLFRRILEAVIRDGKGIEVNTSCFRYGLKDLTPARQILRLYRSLGGEILTLGSDSHKTSHLGFGMEAVKQELKQMGFRTHCTYRNMEPVFHDL